MDGQRVREWIAAYERAWRTPGTAVLDELFTEDATYQQAPYREPVVGRSAIASMWEAERAGPDETFRMTSEPVAVDGDTGVVRVEVAYGEPVRREYRDLWIIRFAGGRTLPGVRGVALLAGEVLPPGLSRSVSSGPPEDQRRSGTATCDVSNCRPIHCAVWVAGSRTRRGG